MARGQVALMFTCAAVERTVFVCVCVFRSFSNSCGCVLFCESVHVRVLFWCNELGQGKNRGDSN